MPLLEIKNLKSGYKQLNVLKNIDMKLNENEIVALIGPNGAGKSTVIKSIFNIADVTQGKIIFNNKNITDLKTHELLKIGISYVPQGKIVFGNLTVKENLEMGAQYIKDKTFIKKRIQEMYERFPILETRKNQLAFGLSGGQQQMLAIARGLMTKPKILLLDEPSLGLSPKIQKEIFKLIQDLKQEGISIFIVEQNAKKAIEIANRTYLLENGKIVLEGKDIIKHKKIKSVYLGDNT